MCAKIIHIFVYSLILRTTCGNIFARGILDKSLASLSEISVLS